MTDYPTITERQQRTWSDGDFARIGNLAVLHGELLCEAVDLHPGEEVLDVAAGGGAASIAAARRWCDVTASDFVPHLLTSAAKLAKCAGLPLRTQVADVQALPFEDDSFDVVLSTFGAMFAPDQQRTADELVRVCRPGGRIGMCNWTPDSLIGEVFRVTGGHVPPPPGARPGTRWGTQDGLEELFGDRVSSLWLQVRQFVFRYRSPEHMLEYFRTWYGPTKVAFASLDDAAAGELAADLLDLYRKYNRASDGTLVAPSDYAEVVAVVA
jgi:ubiquinone/menaquinone biosynthesis C-methylase UbiE